LAQDAAPNSKTKKVQPTWKLTANSNILMSLNAYTRNWDGEENTAILYTAKIDAVAQRQFTEKINWKNTLKLAFGQTFDVEKDSTGDSTWMTTSKSTDLIDFESLAKLTIHTVVNPYLSARLISQFWDMPDNAAGETSDRGINPIELTEALGASFQKVKNSQVDWSTRAGAATRQIIDRRKLDRGDNATYDGGVEIVSLLDAKNKEKWLQFTSQLTLYEALLSSQADMKDPVTDEIINDWRYPDINWENTLVLSIAKYLMLNLYGQLKYDREIHRDARLKSTVSLGLTFLFSNVREEG
jgi:hypothetical protein